MTVNFKQKGFTTSLILVIIAVLVVLGLIVYFSPLKSFFQSQILGIKTAASPYYEPPCKTDADCSKYRCPNCQSGKRTCRGRRCAECQANYFCKDGFTCQDNLCVASKTNIRPTPTKKPTPTPKQATSTSRDYSETGSTSDRRVSLKLQVEGSSQTVPIAKVGKSVTVKFTITNTSGVMIAVVPAIIYPGIQWGDFRADETEQKAYFSWSGSSLYGKFLSGTVGFKYLVLPAGSSVSVYSTVVPRQEGYLDAQGIVHVSSGRDVDNLSAGVKEGNIIGIYNPKKSEVSLSISVRK